MNPGTSARNMSGMLKASQHQMNRAALSAESTNSVPARWAELLATTPDRLPVEAGQPDDQLPGEQRLDLEEAVAVDDAVDDGVHVERHPLVGRDGVGRELDLGRLGLVHRRLVAPRAREVVRYAFAWSMASTSSSARLSAQPGLRDVHAGAAHLLQRRDLADDHLGHPRRAEVHRGVAVDHEHDVAERRDVGAAGRRRAEQAAHLRHLAGQADLVVEDPTGAAAAGEQLHLVGQPGAGRVDEPHDRHLLGERRLRRADHLLDGAGAPRPGLDHRVVGDDHGRHALDRAPPGDDAVGRQPGGHGVGQHGVLDERPLVEQQVDALAGRELALPPQLLQPPLVGRHGPLHGVVDLLAHERHATDPATVVVLTTFPYRIRPENSHRNVSRRRRAGGGPGRG